MSITEVCIPVKEIHSRAKASGVSITVFLTAALIWAIHEEVPQNQLKKPIGLMIPVNLRNYFPSQSMANFFGWIEISCYFQPETTFKDILESVKEQFKKELSRDVIAAKLNDLVSLEKNPVLRLVPLEIKTPFLLAGTTLGGRSITAIYPMWELSGCRRNTGSIFRDSDFLQAQTACSFVPALLEMRWY